MHALSKSTQTKKIIVVKIGGSVLQSPGLLHGFISDIKAAQKQNVRMAVVHGGGPEIDQQLAKKGIEPKKINGLRVTDEETLAVVLESLSSINQLIFEGLAGAGVKAIAFNAAQPLFYGDKLELLDANNQPVDLGLVGKISTTNLHALYSAFTDNAVPVIMSIAADHQKQQLLNVNADHAALAVASVLNANKFINITDVPGVLSDPTNPSSSIAHLRVEQAMALLAGDGISGGMKPKLQSCIDAINNGVGVVQIINGKENHGLLKAVTNYFIGTTISR
jgi:acetylglutamate kinase